MFSRTGLVILHSCVGAWVETGRKRIVDAQLPSQVRKTPPSKGDKTGVSTPVSSHFTDRGGSDRDRYEFAVDPPPNMRSGGFADLPTVAKGHRDPAFGKGTLEILRIESLENGAAQHGSALWFVKMIQFDCYTLIPARGVDWETLGLISYHFMPKATQLPPDQEQERAPQTGRPRYFS